MFIKLPLIKFVSVCLVLCFAAFNGYGQDDSSQKIIFVLDASGSMWGKVADEIKIVSAKTVLKNAINDLPDEAEVASGSSGWLRGIPPLLSWTSEAQGRTIGSIWLKQFKSRKT